jgi:hypothetical protein
MYLVVNANSVLLISKFLLYCWHILCVEKDYMMKILFELLGTKFFLILFLMGGYLAWGDEYAYCSFVTKQARTKSLIPENCGISLTGDEITIGNIINNKQPVLCAIEWQILSPATGTSMLRFDTNFPKNTGYSSWNGIQTLDYEAWQELDAKPSIEMLLGMLPYNGASVKFGVVMLKGTWWLFLRLPAETPYKDSLRRMQELNRRATESDGEKMRCIIADRPIPQDAKTKQNEELQRQFN